MLQTTIKTHDMVGNIKPEIYNASLVADIYNAVIKPLIRRQVMVFYGYNDEYFGYSDDEYYGYLEDRYEYN